MKNLILCCICLLIFSCNNSDKQKSHNTIALADVSWINTQAIAHADHSRPDTVSFKFQNVGETPLIVETVYTTCGCAIANYPKKRIEKNTVDSVVVIVRPRREDSAVFQKSVFAVLNTDQKVYRLTLKGE